MTRTGIKLDLDVGDLVSNAGRARGAISALTEAMKKAQQEERWDDYDRLAIDRDKLQNRNADFERDIRSFANNPHFQTQTPGGGTVFKVDAEYAGLIKSQIDAMKQWTADYEKAVRTGDMTTVRKLSPQIEKQQADFHKVVEQANAPAMAREEMRDAVKGIGINQIAGAINEGFSRRVGSLDRSGIVSKQGGGDVIGANIDETRRTANPVEGIGQSVGGLISSAAAAKDSLRELDREIEKAQKTGNDQKAGYLSFAKSRLEAASHGFEHDTGRLTKDPRLQQMAEGQLSGQALSKDMERLASEIHNNSDKLSKSTAALIEAVKTGSPDEIMKQAVQFGNQAEDFHKVVQNAPAAGQGAKEDAVKGIGINQIANAINEGFSRWVGSLDRSGVINQYGGGDIWGGRIAEERRQADLAGGIAQTGLGLAGAIFGLTPWGAASGGPLVWGAIGAGGGKAIDSALHIDPNKEATEAAYAGLWQNRSGQAMELAAVMGTPGDVRGSFKTAADTAARYGYSAEEGMEAMKEAARQGLGGQEAADITSRAFDYERRTGADRGTLMGISTMSARYGAGDALGMGWAGMQASGMKPGQYNEYLRAMQRVMEEGISKGFVRSSEQVVENLTMLSRMTNNDPLWHGENGARRLSEMNAGLEGTTDLSSTSDILAFRAARNVLANSGQKESDYTDVMMLLEKGLTPALFKEIMKLDSSAEGGGRAGIVEILRQQFNMNYTNARTLHDNYDPNKEYTQAELDPYKNEPPPPGSSELEAAKNIEEIRNILTQTGQSYWDDQMIKLPQELAKAIREYNGKTGNDEPVPGEKPLIPITGDMSPEERYDATEQNVITLSERGDYRRAESAVADWRKAEMELLRHNQEELANQEELRRMLIKGSMPWEKDKAAFFTSNLLPSKNDDERAFERFSAYQQFPEARQALDEVYGILRSMTPDQVKKANESNAVNSAIPQDIMTDRTGQALLEAIRNMKITIEESP